MWYDVAHELAPQEAVYLAHSETDAERREKLLEDGVQCAPALYGSGRPKMRAKIWPDESRQLEKSPAAASWVQRDGWQHTATSWVRPDDTPHTTTVPSAS